MPRLAGFVRSILYISVCACMLSAHGQQLEPESTAPPHSWLSGFFHLPIDAFHVIASFFQSKPEALPVQTDPQTPADPGRAGNKRAAPSLRREQSLISQQSDGLTHSDPRHIELLHEPINRGEDMAGAPMAFIQALT